jgi:hypothetical protein
MTTDRTAAEIVAIVVRRGVRAASRLEIARTAGDPRERIGQWSVLLYETADLLAELGWPNEGAKVEQVHMHLLAAALNAAAEAAAPPTPPPAPAIPDETPLEDLPAFHALKARTRKAFIEQNLLTVGDVRRMRVEAIGSFGDGESGLRCSLDGGPWMPIPGTGPVTAEDVRSFLAMLAERPPVAAVTS